MNGQGVIKQILQVYRVLIILFFWLTNVNAWSSKSFLDNVYNYIENVQVYEWGQEKPHVPIIPYTSEREALSFDSKNSSATISLNGNWKFFLVKNPALVPKDFYRTDYDDKSWETIVVPSNWQMCGYETPKFRNISLPFNENPPFVPHEYNPVGMYRYEFILPDTWDEKQVFLRFEGVASASFVWINGQEVGYDQGAMEPAEYNVTSLLKPGKNMVALSVYTYCDGSYLEQQDMWRLSGIFRDVKLIARPKAYIHDYYITTDFDQEYKDGTLNVELDFRNRKSFRKGDSITISLYDSHKNLVDEVGRLSVSSLSTEKVKISKIFANPHKWSAENPYLYNLLIILKDRSGHVIEVLSSKVGFRKVEYSHRALLINGVPVKLNGVNSHQQHPLWGHMIDEATIIKDFELMKRFNINHIRTCHYPPVYEYLQLADEYGLYVIDEVGNEAHATEYISGDEKWLPQYLDRMRQMVYRDRNHPSIIIWSAGNESGEGNNICEIIAEGKSLDASRPAWMYGGNTEDRYPGMGMACEDIIGPRYPSSFELEERVGRVPESEDSRPAYMDEYLSAAGNSLGALDEFWDVIYKYPRCIGGALWDWISPGISRKYVMLKDASTSGIQAHLMGNAVLKEGQFGKGIYLSGNDEWVELYRDPELDITGKLLTLSIWIKPEYWNGSGAILTKGQKQFGLIQLSEDKLEFYVSGKQRVAVNASLPDDWVGKWHHIAGIYDGTKLQLYIDAKVMGEKPCNIDIVNYPWQVNIGKNADTDGSQQRGYLLNATIDNAAIFDKVISVEKLYLGEDLSKDAKLWLDFDQIQAQGDFFSLGIGARSYGIVWPDRTVQPEAWQIKKVGQPVKIEWADKDAWIVSITNRFSFTNLKDLNMLVQLYGNGSLCLEWNDSLSLAPLRTMEYCIEKLREYSFKKGVDYRIQISFKLKQPKKWAPEGFEIAFEDLELYRGNIHIENNSDKLEPLQVREEAQTIKILGQNFEYTFGKLSGTLESLIYNGIQYIKKVPVANIWRAPLANEQDSWAKEYGKTGIYEDGYGLGTANPWFAHQLDKMSLASGDATYRKLKNGQVVIDLRNVLQADTFRTSIENRYVYTVSADGLLTLKHTMTPWGDWPVWIPKVGIQFMLDGQFDKFSWYGRGPQENYCDRKTGYRIGYYTMNVSEMYEPYLIPQEHGNRSDVSYLKLENESGTGIEISSDEKFNCSVSHILLDNLNRAMYPFQLKPVDDITINIDYSNSGVGCTAISTVNKYRTYPKEYTFKMKIKPFAK